MTAEELFNAKIYGGKSIKERWNEIVLIQWNEIVLIQIFGMNTDDWTDVFGAEAE